MTSMSAMSEDYAALKAENERLRTALYGLQVHHRVASKNCTNATCPHLRAAILALALGEPTA